MEHGHVTLAWHQATQTSSLRSTLITVPGKRWKRGSAIQTNSSCDHQRAPLTNADMDKSVCWVPPHSVSAIIVDQNETRLGSENPPPHFCLVQCWWALPHCTRAWGVYVCGTWTTVVLYAGFAGGGGYIWYEFHVLSFSGLCSDGLWWSVWYKSCRSSGCFVTRGRCSVQKSFQQSLIEGFPNPCKYVVWTQLQSLL